MKKVLSFVFLSIIIPLYSDSIDFTVGGSYLVGYHNSLNGQYGVYQQITAPFSLTYYPAYNNVFSFGFRNKIGYGITINNKSMSFSSTYFETVVTYNNYIIEHEIYDNLSFIIKAGKAVKFITGLGVSVKYTFLNIPDGNFSIKFSSTNDPQINFFLFPTGNFNCLNIGPSFDLNLEIIPKTKNFSLTVGFPFEFLIPVAGKINKYNIKSEIIGNYLYLRQTNDNSLYLNFTFGFQLTFSFYHLFELDKVLYIDRKTEP